MPSAPALEAVVGDGQVALKWTAPSSDGGLPILRYQVRYWETVRRPWVTQVVTGWKVVPGGCGGTGHDDWGVDQRHGVYLSGVSRKQGW